MSLWKQKIIFAVCSLCLFFSLGLAPLSASAAGLVPCGGYNTGYGSAPNTNPCNFVDIFSLIAKVTDFLIGVAGVYAVYVIVNNSFYLIVSAGSEENITKHRAGVVNAVLGFCLVLMAYMTVNTVVNVLLTRSLALTANQQCELDLKNPLNYLTLMDPSKPLNKVATCSSISENTLHQ
jgi:hypothetical protein